MTFLTKSSLWNDIELKGILSYKTILSIQSNINNSLSPINNLTPMFIQSSNKTNNKLTINRSKSDGIVENNDKKHIKLSPYTMFYRKLYEYVLSRLDLICYRLHGSQSNKFERIIWNLFENYTQLLFRSRLIQVYKSMPNSKLKPVRSVFIRSINKYDFVENEIYIQLKIFILFFLQHKNSCLTPSKDI
ncbi:unnamed protein product [Rotaria sp. Silwood1]|nr:unnamed protein product [Rotaria sp. Silwood1]CAF1679806.1 unnamed protein product [Rotaria sp. Silwood1]